MVSCLQTETWLGGLGNFHKVCGGCHSLAEDFCQLSLNALAGTDRGEAMKLRALVENQVILILIDSGSSHSFVSSSFLKKVGLKAQPTEARQVKLANGEVLITDYWIPNMS